jgi:hypothetical protein
MKGAAKPEPAAIPISSWSERCFTITPVIARPHLESFVFAGRKSRLPACPLLRNATALILSNVDSSRTK